MEGIIIGLLFSIGMMIKFFVILSKYDAIKGIATGRGTYHTEEYIYEYKGVKYISSGPRPGFEKKKGKEYKIWVKKDNPQKIQSNDEFWAMSFGILFFIGTIYLLITY